MPIRVRLSNATEISEDYKLRQDPPNYQQIDQLTPEDYAKLKSKGEYFWVKVDAVNDFVGIVLEDPVFPQKFMKGEKKSVMK